MIAVELEIDERRLERLAGALEAVPEEVETALRISLAETARSLRTQGIRRMREILGGRPTARDIRGRWFVRLRRRDGSRYIWIGGNDFGGEAFLTTAQARAQSRRRRYVQVAAHTRSGRSVRSFQRRYQAGVNVREESYPEGFFMPVRAGLLSFRREGNRILRLRHPVRDAVERTALEISGDVPDRFYQRFEHQLRRVVEVR